MADAKLPHFNPYDTSEDALQSAIGQMLLVGFDGFTAPSSVLSDLETGQLGGAILFRRNVDTLDQVAALNESIHAACRDRIAPPFVAVDQEGGRVVRLRDPLTPIPPMRALGERDDPTLCARVSEVIATEISALGFNLNFSPVLDVDTNPDNPVIGDRAFSRDPEVVARMAGSFLVGHLMSGVIPCGKHFPGHGDTDCDSHLTLPVLNHDPQRMEAVELRPFARMIEVEIPMLMTAHIRLPALDTVHPATLSHAVITRLLRDELGYDGVVVTDCLEMKAVAEHYSIEEMVELGLRAGIDLFLICHTESKWRSAREHLLEMARANELDRFRVFQSANRIMRLKKSMLKSWRRPWTAAPDELSAIGSEEHRSALAGIESNSVGTDPTEA